MEIRSSPDISRVFEKYPPRITKKLEALRQLILDTASSLDVAVVQETLKWGEPAYVVKGGSTLRIDWKKSTPEVYAMYFICTTSLVDTFRTVYGDLFAYEENRALLFPVEKPLPAKEVSHCIALALQYHKLKDLPLLGV